MSNGQTLLVVGGGSGIGAAICGEAVDQGWRVLSMDIIEVPDSPWEYIHVDLLDPESIASAVEQIRASGVLIDALHITAGVADPTPTTQMSPQRVRDIFQINVVSAIELIAQLSDRLRDGGSIVLFSSIAAIRGGGFFGSSVYAASKAAIDGLTRGLAREFAPRGIRVNDIAPGPTKTPMLMAASEEVIERVKNSTYIGRMCEPSEIAQAALFLSSDQALAITGTTLRVDGGGGIK